jgi:shikimate dehydrogenase
MLQSPKSASHKSACVIGWPIEHSRSPLIHNYWIKQLGLDADYRREAVPPDQFAAFLGGLSERGYVGANVTVPHKEAALHLCAADDRAKAVGAVNTLWLDDGKLRGTNTDVEGFMANLDAAVPTWARGLQGAAVLGAGGAARAVVYGLLERGIERVHVVNRTVERAEALQSQFGSCVYPGGPEQLKDILADVELLVNATTLGMTGHGTLDIDLTPLVPSAVVADIVYSPLDTALLKAARERGLRTVDGLGMLLHQAVGGFTRWFGVQPQVTDGLRALVEADLMRT